MALNPYTDPDFIQALYLTPDNELLLEAIATIDNSSANNLSADSSLASVVNIEPSIITKDDNREFEILGDNKV